MRPTSSRPFSIILTPKENDDFDLIIANHHQVVTVLRNRFPRVPIVSTIHGVIHRMKDARGQDIDAPEHPALEAKVDQFVAVSEEVQAKLNNDYALDSVIIRNFFDVSRFKAKRQVTPDRPLRIMFNSNYALKDDQETQVLAEVARHYGGRLMAVGQNFAMNKNMMEAIEEADIVIGMGRSVLEGVCAGRLGIVHGRWGTGGVVNERNINVLRACNFSGRNSGGDLWTADRFIEEIDANYNEKTIEWGRNYVLREHNAASAADKYLLFAGKKEEVPAVMKYKRARDVVQTP